MNINIVLHGKPITIKEVKLKPHDRLVEAKLYSTLRMDVMSQRTLYQLTELHTLLSGRRNVRMQTQKVHLKCWRAGRDML